MKSLSNQKHIKQLSILLLLMFPLTGMGIDLISPSLPGITDTLHISSTLSKNIIALFLLGAALGNVFVGFLSDAIGRKKLILAGLFSFSAISLLPPLFPNIVIFLLIRLFN